MVVQFKFQLLTGFFMSVLFTGCSYQDHHSMRLSNGNSEPSFLESLELRNSRQLGLKSGSLCIADLGTQDAGLENCSNNSTKLKVRSVGGKGQAKYQFEIGNSGKCLEMLQTSTWVPLKPCRDSTAQHFNVSFNQQTRTIKLLKDGLSRCLQMEEVPIMARCSHTNQKQLFGISVSTAEAQDSSRSSISSTTPQGNSSASQNQQVQRTKDIGENRTGTSQLTMRSLVGGNSTSVTFYLPETNVYLNGVVSLLWKSNPQTLSLSVLREISQNQFEVKINKGPSPLRWEQLHSNSHYLFFDESNTSTSVRSRFLITKLSNGKFKLSTKDRDSDCLTDTLYTRSSGRFPSLLDCVDYRGDYVARPNQDIVIKTSSGITIQ